MSATSPGAPRTFSLGPDGIRRYRTTCKVRIDSHNSEQPIYLSDDVVSIQTQKTIKGVGQANIALTPSKNYLNQVFPNDYINIYFNLHDGHGWVRTFFGLVDRIEEKYEVNNQGQPSTTYYVICSDFMKAIEKTMIYFNPHIVGREDMDGSFVGTPNVGGLALMTRGVVVTGSPSDIVQNFILLNLGFGSQFSLPSSYKVTKSVRDYLRDQRVKQVQGRIGEDARKALRDAGTWENLKANYLEETRGIAKEVAGQDSSLEEKNKELIEKYGLTESELRNTNPNDVQKVSEVLLNKKISEKFADKGGNQAGTFSQGAINILEGTTSEESSLLDVVDIFTFVERRAIDGFHSGQSIWQKQGGLLSIVRPLSNEIVNEMFFDLRPVSSYQDADLFEGAYQSRNDDIGENVDTEEGIYGIHYTPAMVMREYPFSTIEGVDVTGLELLGRQLNAVFFGAIFSDEPNRPGRHVVQIPNLNWSDRVNGESDKLGNKHLDVAVISEQEVMSSQLGRSDSEHFNFMAVESDAILGKNQKLFVFALSPVVTPAHVVRHGLRVRELTTSFARFSPAVIDRVKEIEPQQLEKAEKSEEVEETEVIASEFIDPIEVTGEVAGTLGGNQVAVGEITSHHGYRLKSYSQGPTWVFHNGVDIWGNEGTTPVRAIADGIVVGSAPNGALGGYGNTIIIKHKLPDGTIVFTFYAHLQRREVAKEQTRTAKIYCVSEDIHAKGRYVPGPVVRKGQTIGYVGKTDSSDSGTFVNPAHLHFEILPNSNSVYPSRNKTAVPDIPDPNREKRHLWWTGNNPKSLDPEKFYEERGLTLQKISQDVLNDPDNNALWNDDVIDDDTDDPSQFTRKGAGQDDPKNVTKNTKGQTKSAVDSPVTRAQVARWVLLQDHWYQHNLEYLSGKISMRGAPEIRVGYRLDVVERGMSFYIEGVNHQWKYPNNMTTTLQVTRGQPNYPFPKYVYPKVKAFDATETQRKTGSRLSQYFITPDPIAVRRGAVLRSNSPENALSPVPHERTASTWGLNTTDSTEQDENNIDVEYNEKVASEYQKQATSAAVEAESFNDFLEQSGIIEVSDDEQPDATDVSGTDPTSSVEN